MNESADEFEHQKKSLAVFPGRVSTWIRNANAFVADKRVGDLESVRKELDVAWERYDSFMRIISRRTCQKANLIV